MLTTNGKVFLPHSLYSIIFEAPFEVLEIFDTPIIFSCLSFNFGKQLRVLKSQSGYEGKESRRENRNQGTTWVPIYQASSC